mmetsp:Transcript_31418/g.91790  ORF Transcript_31418/g.91790 Transcript_31418/m.91790 type:complete len:149 (+) Transcript_31418:104-550(+)
MYLKNFENQGTQRAVQSRSPSAGEQALLEAISAELAGIAGRMMTPPTSPSSTTSFKGAYQSDLMGATLTTSSTLSVALPEQRGWAVRRAPRLPPPPLWQCSMDHSPQGLVAGASSPTSTHGQRMVRLDRGGRVSRRALRRRGLCGRAP